MGKKNYRKIFRLRPDLGEKLERRSRETGRPMTQIVEDALNLWFEKTEAERVCELSFKNKITDGNE